VDLTSESRGCQQLSNLDERLSASPFERLSVYSALVAFTFQAKLIESSTARILIAFSAAGSAKRVLRNTIAFREAAYRTLSALLEQRSSESGDVEAINSGTSHMMSHKRLAISAKGVALTWDTTADIERPLWELESSFENLLLLHPLERVRKCAAKDCGVLFLDVSKTGRRRWCSMSNCGNRAKIT
jgi:predicted RNA-binding Zn ribbon-like protein